MSVILGGEDKSLYNAERWGRIIDRVANFHRLCGSNEYRLTLEASQNDQVFLDELLTSLVAGWLSDYEADWHGRIVSVDLVTGLQNYRASTAEQGEREYRNEVKVNYAATSYQTATDSEQTTKYGFYQKVIIDDSLTAAEATQLADSELERLKLNARPFPTTNNAEFVTNPVVTITAIGYLPYEWRTINVGDGTEGTDITGLGDQQIDTVISAIISNDTGLTAGKIETNTNTVSAAELDGKNYNWPRLEYLINRANDDGSIYQARVDEGLVFNYEAITADPHTLHNGYVVGPGGNILNAMQCRPGNWRDANTGYEYIVDELEASPGDAIPRLIQFGYESYGVLVGNDTQ